MKRGRSSFQGVDVSMEKIMTDGESNPKAAGPLSESVPPAAAHEGVAEIPAAAPELNQRMVVNDPNRSEVVFEADQLSVFYGEFQAVRDVSMAIHAREITAFIGPSGCGKTTLLRSFNRMNDLIPSARVEGSLLYHGEDVYGEGVSPVIVRRKIGMVFQKPNPFPKSIYDNVAYGPRLLKWPKQSMDDVVEESLRRAALWDEVKDRLTESALGMSGGQQQRLCIARAIATKPDVLLMDEPCSALDPIATLRIEELMQELKSDYSIVIVTHNMQQAARVSDYTAFLTVDIDDESGQRTGELVEVDRTDRIFTKASDARTEAYISGRFG
jgi:phosphate transport system ATP-binding protein